MYYYLFLHIIITVRRRSKREMSSGSSKRVRPNDYDPKAAEAVEGLKSCRLKIRGGSWQFSWEVAQFAVLANLYLVAESSVPTISCHSNVPQLMLFLPPP